MERPCCEVCGRAFAERCNLLRHKRTVHENVTVACKHCGKTFARNDKRKIHQEKCETAAKPTTKSSKAATITGPSTAGPAAKPTTKSSKAATITGPSTAGPAAKPTTSRPGSPRASDTTCDVCGIICSSRRHVARHKMSVHGNETFTCRYCDKRFSRNDNRRSHETKCSASRSTTAPTEQCDKHVCYVCGMSFSYSRSLYQHVQTTHQNILIPCTKCSKSFTRNSNRVEHEQNCLGSINYNCQFCAESFPTFNRLRFHNKIKHGKRSAETRPNPAKRQRLDPRPSSGPEPRPTPRPEPRLSPSSSPGTGPSSEPRPGPSSYKCGKCPARFESRRELHAHTMSDHPQVGGGALQPRPFADEVAPWVRDNGEVDERLRNC